MEDSFAFLKDNHAFSSLIREQKTNGDSQNINNQMEILQQNRYNSENDLITYTRGCITSADFFINTDKKQAAYYLNRADTALKELVDADEKVLIVLDFTYKSILYSYDKIKHFKYGIQAAKLIDNSFKKYPNNVQIRILYASKLLYAPGFAGGSKKKALDAFNPLSADKELSDWDKYDVYYGIGTALKELNKEKEAEIFLNYAENIYF